MKKSIYIRSVFGLTIALVSASVNFLNAQDLSNSTGIFIDPSVTIHLPGNLKNDGLIMNNGSISIQGNWSSDFVYQGSGRIVLDGADQEFFNNSQAVQELEVNGGGIKSLRGTNTVKGTLALNDGILFTDPSTTLHIAENAAISGGSNSSYVNGSITAHGNGYKYFPLGVKSKFFPIELIDVKGINPVNEVSVHENYPFELTPEIHGLTYWVRKTISGTFDGSIVSIAFDPNDFSDITKVGIAKGVEPGAPVELDFYDEFDVEQGLLNKVTSRVEFKDGVYMLGEKPLVPPQAFYLSTALSPRAALPENRTVKIFGEALEEDHFTFKVFNRNGKVVFETTSLAVMREAGWDGKDKVTGEACISGAYPYILQALERSGKKLTKQGVITIVH